MDDIEVRSVLHGDRLVRMELMVMRLACGPLVADRELGSSSVGQHGKSDVDQFVERQHVVIDGLLLAVYDDEKRRLTAVKVFVLFEMHDRVVVGERLVFLVALDLPIKNEAWSDIREGKQRLACRRRL